MEMVLGAMALEGITRRPKAVWAPLEECQCLLPHRLPMEEKRPTVVGEMDRILLRMEAVVVVAAAAVVAAVAEVRDRQKTEAVESLTLLLRYSLPFPLHLAITTQICHLLV